MAQGMDSSILLPVSTASSCHRVLFTRAIACGIFYGLDRLSNYRNSLVCKDWEVWATPYVWESVSPSVFRVLRPVIIQQYINMVSKFLLSVLRSALSIRQRKAHDFWLSH